MIVSFLILEFGFGGLRYHQFVWHEELGLNERGTLYIMVPS